jgi:hypothetical protein
MCLLKSAHFAGLISQRELRHGLGMLQLIKRYIMDFSIYLLGSSSANRVHVLEDLDNFKGEGSWKHICHSSPNQHR